MNDKLYIVMYHYVRDLQYSRYPQIKGMDYQLFKEQIAFFERNFTVVTMEEVLRAWSGEEDLPQNAMLLTFDDGYIDNYTCVFPVHKEHHMQGAFFIPGKITTENVLLDVNKIHFILASAKVDVILKDLFAQLDYYRRAGELLSNEELFGKYAVANRFDQKEVVFIKRILQTEIEEEIRHKISDYLFQKYVSVPEEVFAGELYMNRDQIKCMKNDGMFIGIHGYDHYRLAALSEDQMKSDIDMALEVMGEFINQNEWEFNYPYGSYNDSVIEYAVSKGCKLGMSTQVKLASLRKEDRYRVPRLNCNDFPPKSNAYLEKGDL